MVIYVDVGLGGSEKVQQFADVIKGWSLPTSSTCLKQFKYQGLLNQVGQSHDPYERAVMQRGPLKTVHGEDFSLLESQTSCIGFEFLSYSLFTQDSRND